MFRRDRSFRDAESLDSRLRPYVGRVGKLTSADDTIGYLHLTVKVVAELRGPFWRRSVVAPREELSWAIVLLSDNLPVEYLDGEYGEPSQALAELPRDELRVRGDVYQIDWLDGPTKADVLREIFDLDGPD